MATTEARRGRPPKLRPTPQVVDDSERLEHQRAIGARLRQQREHHGLSQDDLAVQTGYTKAAIYEIERGKRAPLTWTIALLSRALGCDAGWLAFGD